MLLNNHFSSWLNFMALICLCGWQRSSILNWVLDLNLILWYPAGSQEGILSNKRNSENSYSSWDFLAGQHIMVCSLHCHSVISPKSILVVTFLIIYLWQVDLCHSIVFSMCPPPPMWDLAAGFRSPAIQTCVALCRLTATEEWVICGFRRINVSLRDTSSIINAVRSDIKFMMWNKYALQYILYTDLFIFSPPLS